MPVIDAYALRGRRRRFDLFRQAVRHPGHRPLRLLDVGGTMEYWASMPWQALMPIDVTLLNMRPQAVQLPFTAVVGDARDLSRYADGSFDVVYSNSVIGHVGGLEDQRRMARELQRVGRQIWVQTPNRMFPIDWRTLMPGFHLLPPDVQVWCLRHVRVGRYHRVRDLESARDLVMRIRNLSWIELRMMFPHAQIHAERVCGFAKSFIVVNGTGAPPAR